MSKNWLDTSYDVLGASFKPACQCCGTEKNLILVNMPTKPLKCYLCTLCMGVEFRIAKRHGSGAFRNAVVVWLVCPEHGQQVPKDIDLERLDKTPVFGYPVKCENGKKIWGMSKYQDERIENEL